MLVFPFGAILAQCDFFPLKDERREVKFIGWSGVARLAKPNLLPKFGSKFGYLVENLLPYLFRQIFAMAWDLHALGLALCSQIAANYQSYGYFLTFFELAYVVYGLKTGP